MKIGLISLGCPKNLVDSEVMLGLAHGDDSVPGIGQHKLSSITPEERTTPAGRFVASLGNDLGKKNVVWWTMTPPSRCIG